MAKSGKKNERRHVEAKGELISLLLRLKGKIITIKHITLSLLT